MPLLTIQQSIITFNIQLQHSDKEATVLSDICMVFGGMGPTTLMAMKTMKDLKGKLFNAELIEEGCQLLQQELSLAPDAPGRALLQNNFRGFIVKF